MLLLFPKQSCKEPWLLLLLYHRLSDRSLGSGGDTLSGFISLPSWPILLVLLGLAFLGLISLGLTLSWLTLFRLAFSLYRLSCIPSILGHTPLSRTLLIGILLLVVSHPLFKGELLDFRVALRAASASCMV